MSKAYIINPDGNILRQVRGSPESLAIQVTGTDESLFLVIEDNDSGQVRDADLCINEVGELAPRPGKILDYDLPLMSFEYIAL